MFGFTTGYANGYWRVFAYDGEGRELVYVIEFPNSERADRVAYMFSTDAWKINPRDWSYSD